MRRPVLLAWELGSGHGHVVRLITAAQELKQRGFDPIFAIQRLDSLQAVGFRSGEADFYQAPLWPGLLSNTAVQPSVVPPASLGDVLGNLGLQHEGVIEILIHAWECLFKSTKPVAVVADFSPACLLATHGRIPTIAIGNGFTLPPASASEFSILKADVDAKKYDEAKLLEVVNKALERTGRSTLNRLPQIFAADRSVVACFAETDPYAQLRDTPYAGPFLTPWNARPAGEGNEIFAYLPERVALYPAVLAALENVARSGRTIRAFVPNLDHNVAERLTTAGVTIEPEPVPLDEIAWRSGLIISHGGLGIVSFALAAGLPQLVIALDTEKLFTGQALERLGTGRCIRVKQNNPLEIPLLTQLILETAANEALAARARSLAPYFVRRLEPRSEEIVADYVEELGRN